MNHTNKSAGVSLVWTPTGRHTVMLDWVTWKQKYDNKIKINDQGNAEYPVGTVDNIEFVWRGTPNNCTNSGNCTRAEPRVGYSPSQEFTRDG